MIPARIRQTLGLAMVFASFSTPSSSAASAESRIVSEELNRQILLTTRSAPAQSGRWLSIFPPGYNGSSKHYPVIFFLPNAFDNYRSLFDQQDARKLFDNAIRSGLVGEFILISVDMTTPLGCSWYLNSAVTGNCEDFFIKELVPYMDATFRTLSNRDSRGIAGDRMGGYGAIRLAMRHPDVFSSVYALHPVGTGSGVQIMYSRRNWELLANAKSLNDLKGDPFSMVFTTIFQAHLPDPDKPPLYDDLPAHKAGD